MRCCLTLAPENLIGSRQGFTNVVSEKPRVILCSDMLTLHGNIPKDTGEHPLVSSLLLRGFL